MGPHGGYIKMPGEFHVEVVPKETNRLLVYLLDLQSQDPVTRAPELRGQLQQGGQTRSFTCDSLGDHYICNLPEGTSFASGEITIDSARKGTDRPATFQLPFVIHKL